MQAPDQRVAVDGDGGLNRAFCVPHSEPNLTIRISGMPTRSWFSPTQRGLRRGGGPFVSAGCRGYYLTAAASFALSDLANLRRKRSTRPAVSTRRCLPVKNGWQTEQIST